MGAAGEETKGGIKKAVGKATGNDELKEKGEEQEQEGIKQEKREHGTNMVGDRDAVIRRLTFDDRQGPGSDQQRQ